MALLLTDSTDTFSDQPICIGLRGRSLGLVVNEAMACGLLAVVSDRCGCIVDLIRRGKSEGIFRCGDNSSIATLINHYAKSPDVLHRHGQNALAHVGEGYGISTTSKHIVTALRQIVVNRPI